jgi:hypothetical protein
MMAFILLAITLFLSLMYIEAILVDYKSKGNRNGLFRTICRIVLPILWSLFFYLIHVQ